MMDPAKEMADMQSGGETPAEDAAPLEENPEAKETFFLPSDFPNASNLKAGDSISMKVVGVSDDGEVEVSMDGGSEEGPSLGDDLRQSLTEKA